MNLSLYLLAGERVTLDGILAPDKLGPGEFLPVPTLAPLPFAAKAFLKKAPGNPPDWRSWVAGAFDLGERSANNPVVWLRNLAPGWKASLRCLLRKRLDSDSP